MVTVVTEVDTGKVEGVDGRPRLQPQANLVRLVKFSTARVR